SILEQALSFTKEKNLPILDVEVEKAKEKIEGRFQEMRILLRENASFSKKLEKTNLIDYIRRVQGMKFEE
ncbi:MAG: hypothetical protein ACXAD7_21315, partial [Candidatus Kariarchaeaceae archaeon]